MNSSCPPFFQEEAFSCVRILLCLGLQSRADVDAATSVCVVPTCALS